MPRTSAVQHLEPVAGQEELARSVLAFVNAHPDARLSAPDGSTQDVPEFLLVGLGALAESLGSGRGVDLLDAEADSLTPAEAATLIGISRPTVLKLIDEGVLTATNVPGSTHRRLPRVEVEDFRARRLALQQELVEAADDARESGLFVHKVGRRRSR